MPGEPREIVAFLIAVSFAAGLNVSGTVAVLGLLARFGVIHRQVACIAGGRREGAIGAARMRTRHRHVR